MTNIQPQISPRLSHLTAGELHDLTARFEKGSETVGALLIEFNIDARASALGSLLPSAVGERNCPYCPDQQLFGTRKRGVGAAQRRWWCPACGHQADSACRCANCSAVATEMAHKLEAQKRAVIRRTFVPEPADPGVYDLTLKEAVCLLAIFRHSASEDLTSVAPYDARKDLLAPTDAMLKTVSDTLRFANLVAVNPESKTDAFIFNEDLSACLRFYPGKAHWLFLPGVDVNAKREFIADIEIIARDGPWPSMWSVTYGDLWREIAKAECLQYYSLQLQLRNFEADFGEKTDAVFDALLENFSIGQVFNLTWQAVRDTHDYVMMKKLPKQHARNSFIGAIQRKGDKFLAEGWSAKASRRDFACPQSVISAVFFDIFAGIGARALETIPHYGMPERLAITGEIPF